MPYARSDEKKKYYLANKDRILKKCKEYRENDIVAYKTRNTKSHLKKTYGITIDDYNIMVDNQNQCCALCLKHVSMLSKPLFVDHDHSTGKIRGLLCITCNTALGSLGDNVEGLKRALAYVEGKL